jgi:hypothetical protein
VYSTIPREKLHNFQITILELQENDKNNKQEGETAKNNYFRVVLG